MTDQEINTAVARALGYSLCSSGEPPYPHWHTKEEAEKFKSGDWLDICTCSEEGSDFEDHCRQLPNFSEDIKAAWQIVEWLIQTSRSFCLYVNSGRLWSCSITIWGQVEPESEVNLADTAAKAICLAFLKMKGDSK
jgi:hypothetical protein